LREAATLLLGRNSMTRNVIYNPRRLTDQEVFDLIREVRDKIDEIDEAMQMIQQEMVRRSDGGEP